MSIEIPFEMLKKHFDLLVWFQKNTKRLKTFQNVSKTLHSPRVNEIVHSS